MPETKFEATNHLGSCRRGSLMFRNSSLTLLPPAACSHFLRLLSLLPSYASPGGAVCVTQMMCLCPMWILEALFISFSQLFLFCCGCCFHPKPFERFAVMNSWDLVVRCPSFSVSLPPLHSTRSCFPLVGTWLDQSASTIKKMLLILIVTAVGLVTGSITLHSLKESNRSIWNAVPNHLPRSSSSAFYRHASSRPPRSTWRVNWLWNCRFCWKHRRVCKNFSILH